MGKSLGWYIVGVLTGLVMGGVVSRAVSYSREGRADRLTAKLSQKLEALEKNVRES